MRTNHVAILLIAAMLTSACGRMPWATKHPTSTSSTKLEKSLYERLGGDPAIRAVVHDFVSRSNADANVNFTREGHPNHWQATPENVAKLEQRLVEYIGSATGGPMEYHGKDMVTAHTGMQITNAEFDALAADLKASLEKFNVPPREQAELLKIVGGTRGAIVGN